jgi:hypothetical protein
MLYWARTSSGNLGNAYSANRFQKREIGRRTKTRTKLREHWMPSHFTIGTLRKSRMHVDWAAGFVGNHCLPLIPLSDATCQSAQFDPEALSAGAQAKKRHNE